MSIATRATGRRTSSFKRLVIDEGLHTILKRYATDEDSTLAEVTHVKLCLGMGLDPVTLKPAKSLSQESTR